MGGTDNDGFYSGGVAVDAHDKVYVTGSFNTGTANYTATFGQFTLSGAGGEDVFAARWTRQATSSGRLRWEAMAEIVVMVLPSMDREMCF